MSDDQSINVRAFGQTMALSYLALAALVTVACWVHRRDPTMVRWGVLSAYGAVGMACYVRHQMRRIPDVG